MRRTAQDVTETELSVLEVLWNSGPATIRQITEVLYPRGQTSHYATVQKLLERLEDKKCVRRDRSSNVHVFQAALERDDLISRRLQALAEQLCGGSLTPILMNLVQAKKLTAEERKKLREFIDRMSIKRG